MRRVTNEEPYTMDEARRDVAAAILRAVEKDMRAEIRAGERLVREGKGTSDGLLPAVAVPLCLAATRETLDELRRRAAPPSSPRALPHLADALSEVPSNAFAAGTQASDRGVPRCPECGQPAVVSTRDGRRWATCVGSPGRSACGFSAPARPGGDAPASETEWCATCAGTSLIIVGEDAYRSAITAPCPTCRAPARPGDATGSGR